MVKIHNITNGAYMGDGLQGYVLSGEHDLLSHPVLRGLEEPVVSLSNNKLAARSF